MKNIFLVLAVIGLSFTSCKKQNTQPTQKTSTTTPPTSVTGDSVWVDLRIEAPQSATFNYHYDTTNTRILLNGHRILNKVFNIYTDGASLGGGITRYCNYADVVNVEQTTQIHMSTHDSLTIEIDSLFYTNGNPANRGGGIYISVNARPVINISNPTKQIYTSANNIDPITFIPVGRAMGNAPANGMAGSTQSFYWYLGGKFKYTWVKP